MEMTNFLPPRRMGLLLHGVTALLQAGGGGLALWQAIEQAAGLKFVLLVVAALILLGSLPFIIYRLYALLQGGYSMDRDRLRIRWGLRGEDIPLPAIEWVRPADELGYSLPLPFLPVPGAYLGTRTVSGLGEVEFIASSRRKMLLVATPEKVYAISPDDVSGFMRTFQQAAEMGSLELVPSQSLQPLAFFQRIWQSLPARLLILSGLILTLVLFIFVGLAIPTLNSVPLGFDANLQPLEAVPSERLLLLPVLGALMFVMDFSVGLFFFRRDAQRPASYLLWAGGVVTPITLDHSRYHSDFSGVSLHFTFPPLPQISTGFGSGDPYLASGLSSPFTQPRRGTGSRWPGDSGVWLGRFGLGSLVARVLHLVQRIIAFVQAAQGQI